MALDYLTLGVRSSDRHLNGALRLHIAGVNPNSSEILTIDCYKGLVEPQMIELFELPEPRPEDREFYWELSKGAGE